MSPSSPPGESSTVAAGQGSTSGRYKGGEASIEEFGEEAKGAERGAMLEAFDGELNAIAGKDYATACFYLSNTVHESLARLARGSRAACAQILPGLLSPTATQVARRQANGRMTRVRIQGDRGFVIFHAPGAKLYQQTMVREGGEWKDATLGASVLVPET